MNFQKTGISSFRPALRGMRNPMNSWDKSDSTKCLHHIGPNDLNLAQKLVCAGNEHAKFMRQIIVWVDITAPLYWWKEFDTYKVGTVANSTSTMHKLTSQPITEDLFETSEDLWDLGVETLTADLYVQKDSNEDEYLTTFTTPWVFKDEWEYIIETCEKIRQKYIETKDKRYWRALIQILPESWLQTRTVSLSYANLRNIYFQ